MTLADITGTCGVALILVAYFLNIRKILDAQSTPFLLMNAIGASIACWSSWLLGSIPFIILEGTWAMVSLVALVRKR